jgi:hypothetical protein
MISCLLPSGELSMKFSFTYLAILSTLFASCGVNPDITPQNPIVQNEGFKNVGDNVYTLEDGALIAFPDVRCSTPDGISTRTDCGGTTGPFSKRQTPPGTASKLLNYMSARIKLPTVAQMKFLTNSVDRFLEEQNRIPIASKAEIFDKASKLIQNVFIYGGGSSNNANEIDAGFVFSTKKTALDGSIVSDTGDWRLFMSDGVQDNQGNLINGSSIAGYAPGSEVRFQFWTIDDAVFISGWQCKPSDASCEDRGTNGFGFGIKLPASSSWNIAGINNKFKQIASIAQDRTEQRFADQSTQALGLQFTQVEIGFIDPTKYTPSNYPAGVNANTPVGRISNIGVPDLRPFLKVKQNPNCTGTNCTQVDTRRVWETDTSKQCQHPDDPKIVQFSTQANGGSTTSITLSNTPLLSIPTLNPVELTINVVKKVKTTDNVKTSTFKFSNQGQATMTYSVEKLSTDTWLTITKGITGTLTPGQIATIEIQAECPVNPTLFPKKPTLLKIFTTGTTRDPAFNGANALRKRTEKVALTCIPVKPKASIAPNPINITAPVGSTASGSFTLENAGEVDSTLDYIVYRPGQTAGVQVAASNPISTRALPPGSGFPSPIGSVDARFTSPSQTTGSLLKVSATTAASTTIPVSATCSTVGSFSSVVEVTYATGDLTATGTPVFASSDVTVNVKCTGPIYSGDQGGGSIDLTAKVGETVNSSAIGYSNTGIGSSSDPATLTTSISTNASWLTVTPSSSSVAPGSGSSFVITASCAGLTAGTYSGVVTLSTNTGKTFTWTVNLTCLGLPMISVTPTNFPLVKVETYSEITRDLTISNTGDAPLEILFERRTYVIAPQASLTFPITEQCDADAGTFTDRVEVHHNAQNAPSPISIPITIECVAVLMDFTAEPVRDFFGSWTPWSGLAKSSVTLTNPSSRAVPYTIEFEGGGPTLDGGNTGTLPAHGENTISFTAGCGNSFKTLNGGFTPNFPDRYIYTLRARNTLTNESAVKIITLRCFGVSVAATVFKWHTFGQQFFEHLYPGEPDSPTNPLVAYWRYAGGCVLTSPTSSVCPSKDAEVTGDRWRTHNDYFEAAKALLDPLIGVPTEGGWRQECFNNDCLSEPTDIPPSKIETWESAKSRIPPYDN